jgi:hypothetical protein
MLSYGIKLPEGVIEKEELVNTIVAARVCDLLVTSLELTLIPQGPNGCLSKENEVLILGPLCGLPPLTEFAQEILPTELCPGS